MFEEWLAWAWPQLAAGGGVGVLYLGWVLYKNKKKPKDDDWI